MTFKALSDYKYITRALFKCQVSEEQEIDVDVAKS